MKEKIVKFLEMAANDKECAYSSAAAELLEEVFQEEVKEAFSWEIEHSVSRSEYAEIIQNADKFEFVCKCRFATSQVANVIRRYWNRLDDIMKIVGGMLDEQISREERSANA